MYFKNIFKEYSRFKKEFISLIDSLVLDYGLSTEVLKLMILSEENFTGNEVDRMKNTFSYQSKRSRLPRETQLQLKKQGLFIRILGKFTKLLKSLSKKQ